MLLAKCVLLCECLEHACAEAVFSLSENIDVCEEVIPAHMCAIMSRKMIFEKKAVLPGIELRERNRYRKVNAW